MADRPPVLFINTDQLRPDFLSCYGFPVQTTPHIDALAAEGVRFVHAYTQCPICVPARYSLTTGEYVSSHGAISNRHAPHPTQRSLLETFNDNGYHTVAVGKLHHNPPDQAFGFQEVHLHDGTFPSRRPFSEYSAWLEQEGVDENELCYAADVDDVPEKVRLKDQLHWGRCRLPEAYCESTFLADRAIRFVHAYDRDAPVFLYLSFVAPHSPYCPPAPYDTLFDPADMPVPPREDEDQTNRKHRVIRALKEDRYGPEGISDEVIADVRAQYAGLVAHLDHHVGRAVEAFRERFGKDALICFTSDHGDLLGEHYKCEKHMPYEGATRIPYIVCRPGHVPGGVVADALAEQIDMFPTVLGLCGVAWDTTSVAGRDRSASLLAGAPDGPAYVFSENWDSVGPHAAYFAMARSRTHKCAVILDRDRSRPPVWELYDLVDDPNELDNIAGDPAMEGILARHREALTDWWLRTRRHMPPPGYRA